MAHSKKSTVRIITESKRRAILKKIALRIHESTPSMNIQALSSYPILQWQAMRDHLIYALVDCGLIINPEDKEYYMIITTYGKPKKEL